MICTLLYKFHQVDYCCIDHPADDPPSLPHGFKETAKTTRQLMYCG